MIKFIFFTYRVFYPARYGACRYVPTCSEYMEEAIKKHGLARGILKGIKRLTTCNPLSSRENFDPVR